MEPSNLVKDSAGLLEQQPFYFYELLAKHPQVEYRTFLVAWGELRTNYQLARDEEGRYLLKI